MKTQNCLAFACALFAALAFPVVAHAQDPLKVGPNIYKLNFENDFVRVCDISFKPGDKIGMHSHPDHLVYMRSSGMLKLSYPDGKAKDMQARAGEVLWIKAESHAAENPGTTEVRGIVIELKDAAKPLGKVPAGDDPAKVAPESYKVLLDNERVRVLETRLKPGGKLPMHSHPSHVTYAFTDAKVKFTSPDGASKEEELKAGKARWGDPVAHAVENVGSSEAHVLNVELKPAGKPADRKPEEKKP
ncbi:MAG: cupin domain-containing protein [Burkholderiales bacterium]